MAAPVPESLACACSRPDRPADPPPCAPRRRAPLPPWSRPRTAFLVICWPWPIEARVRAQGKPLRVGVGRRPATNIGHALSRGLPLELDVALLCNRGLLDGNHLALHVGELGGGLFV